MCRVIVGLVLGVILAARPGVTQSRDPRLARIQTVAGIVESVGGLAYPQGVAVDGAGTLFVADTNHNRVLRIAANGAASVMFTVPTPDGLAVDAAGNLYIASRRSHNVWRVRTNGVSELVAGIGRGGFSGDGGPARAAMLSSPTGVAVDADGNVFIADLLNHRIRRVSAKDGVITTVAGTGKPGSRGDAGPAIDAQLNGPEGVALDREGHLYITDQDNSRLRKVSRDGTISTVARLKGPIGVAVDGAGDIFVADTEDHRILRISPFGEKTVVAGNGRRALKGDGGPAAEASLAHPEQLVVDHAGNIFVADTYNHAIRVLVEATVPAPALGVVFVPPPRRPAASSSSPPPSTGRGSAAEPPRIPNPVLAVGARVGPPANNAYQLLLENREAYAELFRPAPELPPCGLNANSSRTWVDIFMENGTRVYGYCAINSLDSLSTLLGVGPPGTRLYIVLRDRATNSSYRSNVVELR